MSMSESKSEVVLALAEEFLERYRQGERPSLKEYVDRRPELAAEIKEVFPAMAMMENIALADESVAQASRERPRPEELQQLGDYRIIREVGHGGMGVVYEAEQVSLGRHVALKLLPRKMLLDERSKRRFEREAKAAAKLHHTNIVPVFGVGEHDGLPYYIMQFIPGQGLDAILDELRRMQAIGRPPPAEVSPTAADVPASAIARSLLTGAFPAPEAAADGEPVATAPAPPSATASLSSSAVLPVLPNNRGQRVSYWQSVAQVGVQVAEALEHAHKQGVLHRDVKPSNLLLDARGTVWVTDFGLAKADDQQDLTHTGDVLGTLRYLPPEAFDGKSDARSDVCSLGLTLYELLALRPAFDEKERNKLVKQVMSGEPPPLTTLNAAVPRDLATIVHKAIDKEPGRRYQTAADLAADLRRFVEDRPILARRSGTVEKTWRWCKRNPWLAGLATAAVLFLIAAVVAATAAAVIEGTARERLEADLYARNLALAEREWFTNNPVRMGPLLEQCPKRRIGWEWHLLSRLRYEKPLQLVGHEQFVIDAAFSPDGARLASSGIDAVRVWDARTGRQLFTLGGHTGLVLKLAFSRNGQYLVTSGDDKRVIVWDLASRQPACGPLLHANRVRAALHPDSRLLATACIDPNQADPVGEVKLWDVPSGRTVATMQGHRGMIESVDFSPDGTLLATASWDGTVIVWDVPAAKSRRTLSVHEGPAHAAVFTPDGRQLVTGDGGGSVKVWDVATGQLLLAERGHSGPILCLAVSPDGKRIVTGGWDNALIFWDAANGRRLLALHGHPSDIFALAFSLDGQRLASAGADSVVTIWDGRPLDGIPGPRPLRTLETDSNIMGLAFLPGGRQLVVGELISAEVTVWDWDARTRLARHRGHTGQICDLAVSPDGRLAASAGWYDRTVRVWDLHANRPLHVFEEKDWPFASSVAFSPDGRRLAYAAEKVVKVCAVGTWREVAQLEGHLLAVEGLAFSPDGRSLATAGEDRTVRLWDTATWQTVHVLRGHTLPVQCVVFSPDGRTVITSSWDSTIRLWDAAGGKELHVLRGHSGRVWSVAISPDGRWLVSGGDDWSIRIWDAAARQERHTLWWHPGSIFKVAFSPDSAHFAAGGNDGTVTIGKLPLTPGED